MDRKLQHFTFEESYTEYLKGKRKVMVRAESEQAVKDGDYEEYDVIEELGADGEVQETYMDEETIEVADVDNKFEFWDEK